MSTALSQHKIENGSHRRCKVPASVCGDQNWYLNPNHNVFLSHDQVLLECFTDIVSVRDFYSLATVVTDLRIIRLTF